MGAPARALSLRLLERTCDLATLSEDEFRRLAAEAARDRDAEALWALTKAHLTLHGLAGSGVSRQSRNAGVRYVREPEGRLKPSSVGVKLAAAKAFYAAS